MPALVLGLVKYGLMIWPVIIIKAGSLIVHQIQLEAMTVATVKMQELSVPP